MGASSSAPDAMGSCASTAGHVARSVIPDGVKGIAYVSDVEGHWDYFCSFVELSSAVSFTTKHDGRKARDAKDLELEIEDGWHFVFGGDTCDKGPGTLRFQEAMVRFKEKYPDRVHLLLGNRDINKMALTSDLHEEEVAKFRQVPGERRSNGGWRVSGEEFIRKAAAKAEKLSEEEVTEEMLTRYCTKATKLKYMFLHKMNSPGEFEFRRDELAFLRGVPSTEINDETVVQSFEHSFAPSGWARRYLELGQLAVLIEDALFVHGQIIGDEFQPGKTRGADENGCACVVGVVPEHENHVEDVREWLTLLNSWSRTQVEQWKASPTWSAEGGANTRGGADLMNYASASTTIPSVVYCRWLTSTGMPKEYPPELSDQLKRQKIRFVVVGHTPHGNAPTVVQSNGVTIVMGDTSFSDLKPYEPAFPGDTRGSAASEIYISNGKCGVRGHTEKGQIIDYKVCPEKVVRQTALPHTTATFRSTDSCEADGYVGYIQTGEPKDKRFFTKARLPPAPGFPDECYIMCNIQGFKYEYALLNTEQMKDNLTGPGLTTRTKQGLAGCGKLAGLDEGLVQSVFKTLDRDSDGFVTRRELAAACTDRVVRDALLAGFPKMSMDQIFKEMDEDLNGRISIADFRKCLGPSRVHSRHLALDGLVFEVVGDDDAVTTGEFPSALGPFSGQPTQAIRPEHLQCGKASSESGSYCRLMKEAISTDELRKICGKSATLRILMSPLSPVNLPDAARSAAQIPLSAESFAWVHPIRSDWHLDHESDELASNPDAMLLLVGGFAYFDSAKAVIQINATAPSATGGLKFGPPRRWEPEWTMQLRQQGKRWHRVTLRSLLVRGALEFCWLRPNEFVAGPGVPEAGGGQYGAFVYLSNTNEPEESGNHGVQ